MSQLYSGWVQLKRGLIEQPVWQAYENSALLTLESAGFREAWDDYKETYPVDFQAEVRKLLEQGRSP